MFKLNSLLSITILLFISTSCFALKMPKMPPTFVETITVQTGTRQIKISATGTLIAIPGIVVKPEISGRVTKIYFKSGDTVAAGTPLIELNQDVIKAQLADAEATLKLNKLEFERSASLIKTHDISKSAFDTAQANYNSAQARVDQNNAQLRQTIITAPFAGKLGLTQVNVGDFLAQGQNIVNLQTIDPLYIDFSIPEIYLNKVAIGQEVIIHSDAFPNETFNGKVVAYESLINPTNRTLKMRASIPNQNGKLLPGAFVDVTLLLSDKIPAIMVQQTAVVFSPEGNYVFKVVNNKAVKTMVTIGERDANQVVISDGLKVGDVIVTAGQLKVADGADVVISTTPNDKNPTK